MAVLICFAANVENQCLGVESEQSESEIEVEIGFGGQAKLGCWQPFFVTTPDHIEPARFELTVIDGDDTSITYAGALHSIGSGLNRHQGYVKFGRAYGSAKLKLLDQTGIVVASKEIPLGRTSKIKILDSTQSMSLTLEPDNKLCRTIESTAMFHDRGGAAAFIAVAQSGSLPVEWFCYEGIDTIFLVTSDLARVESISEPQWAALERWVENGGRFIFSAAYNSEKLFGEQGPLNRFAPGKFVAESSISESDRLEAFAKKGQLIGRQGAPIPVSTFETLSGRAYAQDGKPLIVRTAKGFGEVVCVTFDLDSPRITAWSGYSNLVQRLFSQVDVQESAQAQTVNPMGGSVSHYGYEDLIGQLRVPLDRFRGVQFLSFNLIAVLIGLYILCIGPGDFFFLKKLTGKMELTWITFPLLTLFFCGLAYGISSLSRPATVQLNQLEIIDIDAESRNVRGSAWSNLYTPRAGHIDIAVESVNALGLNIESDLLSWHGLPGSGLGGMQTKSSPGIVLAGYQHAMNGVAAETIGASHSELKGVPMNVSATKPLFTSYYATFPTPIRSKLEMPLNTGRLDGTLVNPLDVRLTNVRLLFENYAYLLKQKQLDPGEAIDVLTEMKERTVRSMLTRRTKLADDETKSQNSPWEQTDTRVIRIADMLMFYEAAGGNGYTGLTHAYQNFVDMSEHLELGRAILVGEIDVPCTSLKLDGQTAKDNYDHSDTIVRIVFPVVYEGK